VSLMGVVIVKFTHAIAMVLKRIKVWAGRGGTFGAGVIGPFVASLPTARNRAPTALCRGGCKAHSALQSAFVLNWRLDYFIYS
jgi:hypothetical protein